VGEPWEKKQLGIGSAFDQLQPWILLKVELKLRVSSLVSI